MKRRALLTSMGVGMAGMAGCLGGNSNNGGSTPNENQGTPIGVSTPSGEKAQFELVSISATGSAEVSKDYTFDISVKNTGGQPGVYRAPAKTRTGDNVRYSTKANAMVYVEPGQTKTATIQLQPFESVGTADVRFNAPENTWKVDVVGPDLAIGEPFRVDGFDITYESVELTDSVTYTLSGVGTEQTYTPSEGKQFAVVIVKVESVDRSSWMADAANYTVIVDGNPRGPHTDAGYNKRSLSSGQTQRVELSYEVPADVSKSDLIFRYDAVRQDKYARWSTSFAGRDSGEGGSSDSGSGSDESESGSSDSTTTQN